MAVSQGHMIAIDRGGKRYWLPTPKTYKVTQQDFDSDVSTRSTSGTMVRDRITTKRRIDMEWPPSCADDVSYILSLVYTSDEEYGRINAEDVTLPLQSQWETMDENTRQGWRDIIFNNTGLEISDDYVNYTDEQVAALQAEIYARVDEVNAERSDRIFFDVYFMDPRLTRNGIPNFQQGTFYVGDRVASMLWSDTGDKDTTYWDTMTFALIEK